MSSRLRNRKSTARRRAERAAQEQDESLPLSPEELRRRWLIQAGVWFLIVVFVMSSGVMCFSVTPAGSGAGTSEQASAPEDPLDAEIRRWGQALEANPRDPVALANLGYYHGQRARAASAKIAQHRAPSAPVGGPQTGEAPELEQEEASDFALAADYLQKALEVDPSYAFALRELAQLRISEKKWEEARALFARTLAQSEGGGTPSEVAERKVQRAQACRGMALLESERGQPLEAIRWLDQSIELEPGGLDAYLMKGQLLADQGRAPEALELLERAAGIAGQMDNREARLGARFQKFQIQMKSGDKAGARRELETAREEAQRSGDARAQLLVSQLLYGLDAPPPAPAPQELPEAPASGPKTPGDSSTSGSETSGAGGPPAAP